MKTEKNNAVNVEKKYLVRIDQTERQFISGGKSMHQIPSKVRCHLWCEEKNNTWCNQYLGMRKSQPESAIFDGRWKLIIQDKEPDNICRMCIKGVKKGIESVKDAHEIESPKWINE